METIKSVFFFQVKIKRVKEKMEKRKLKKNVKQKENKCLCQTHKSKAKDTEREDAQHTSV